MHLVERSLYDWHELSEEERARIRFAAKAEAAQVLRQLPRMIAAKVAIEIVAESIGATNPRHAISAVGTLASDLAVKTLVVLEQNKAERAAQTPSDEPTPAPGRPRASWPVQNPFNGEA